MSQVFISYAHSTAEHAQVVGELAKQIRVAGPKVVLDVDVKGPQGPEEGWPRWMKNQIEEADWVLLFFDEKYLRKYDGHDGGGGNWEGCIITNTLYRAQLRNTKFIPLVADDADPKLIALELAGATHYKIPSQGRELAQRLAKARGDSRTSEERPSSVPDLHATHVIQVGSLPPHHAFALLGREDELKVLDRARDQRRTRIFEIVAFGGVGKTSLVAEWLARQSQRGWAGFDHVFIWSFYSAGAQDQGIVSSEPLLRKALAYFGDEQMANSQKLGKEKGAGLADLIAKSRVLLVLDGLEPLQHPPGSSVGQLRDEGLRALLSKLAAGNSGFCIVTTRVAIAELRAPEFRDTVVELMLGQLSETAGAAVLHSLGVRRSGQVQIAEDDRRLRFAARRVRGHALTLRMLGNYLRLAFDGNIRSLAKVRFRDADREYRTNPNDPNGPYGHAFKAMAAYERWFESGGESGRRQLSILRLLGLFDRPADEECMRALRARPSIEGLSATVVSLSDEEWNIALRRLEDSGLASVASRPSQAGISSGTQQVVDTHPLVREYFGSRLREHNEAAWRLGHWRLFEHLRGRSGAIPSSNCSDLHPSYQAIGHGFAAGDSHAALTVFRDSVRHTSDPLDFTTIRAPELDLAVLSLFLSDLSRKDLDLHDQAYVYVATGATQLLLGQVRESIGTLQIGFKQALTGELELAALPYSERYLSLLIGTKVLCGDFVEARDWAHRAVQLTHKAHDLLAESTSLCLRGLVALNIGGDLREARADFEQAESLHQQWLDGDPARGARSLPILEDLRGRWYCDLLNAMGRHDEAVDRATQIIGAQEARARRGLVQVFLGLHYLTCAEAILARSASVPNRDLDEADSLLGKSLEHVKARLPLYVPRVLIARGESAAARVLRGLGEPQNVVAGAKAGLAYAEGIAASKELKTYLVDSKIARVRLTLASARTGVDAVHELLRDDVRQIKEMVESCQYGRRRAEVASLEIQISDGK